MAVKTNDPKGRGRTKKSPYALSQRPGSSAPLPDGGFFVDLPGNNASVQGGLGIDLPGGGRAGISLGPGIDIPGLGRLGFGAGQVRQGKATGPKIGQSAGLGEDPQGLTFADYLKMANEMGLGGEGADYSALMEQLKRNGAQGDAQLQAMYGALERSIDADAAPIAQNYDANGQRLTQNSTDASAQVNAAYQAARDAQTQQFQQLGIQDAAGVLAAQGGAAGADQANAVGNIAQNSAANQNENATNRTSALNYNTGIANAAGLEGAVQRAGLQQALANKLAELETAQTQDAGNSQKSLFSAALQMAQNPGVFDPNYQGNPQDSLEAQLLAAKITGQDLKNQALAANSTPVGANLTQYQTLAQAYGIDPSNQEEFLKFIELVNSTR